MSQGGHADPSAPYRIARAAVLERIVAACRRVDRDPAAVTLVAVSKGVDVERLRHALAAGLDLLGENRVQEAAAKAARLPAAHWQFVGLLQANKIRRALEVFEAIQSVDTLELAERMDRLVPEVRPGGRYPILLQVNIDGDPAKAGFAPEDLPGGLARIAALEALDVRGLMTIGRLVNEPEGARPTFRRLAELGATLRDGGAQFWPELSMGMSDDFEVAVEEGATIVRVGRALFGERHPPH